MRAQLLWPVEVLWTGGGCPESGRFGAVLNQLDAAGSGRSIFQAIS